MSIESFMEACAVMDLSGGRTSASSSRSFYSGAIWVGTTSPEDVDLRIGGATDAERSLQEMSGRARDPSVTTCPVSPSEIIWPSEPDDFVAKPQETSPKFRNVRANQDFVIVIGGCLVAAIALSDDQKRVVIRLHVAIRKSARAAVFSPADFKPDEVIGIIDDAHFVGLGVAHT